MFDWSISPLLLYLLVCLCLQGCAWAWQARTNNADIVDITWSGLLVIGAIIFFFYGKGDLFHRYVVLLLPGIWYLRLTWHLVSRYRIDEEDGRYRQLRQFWHRHTQFKFFLFFFAQALLAWCFAYPAYVIANKTAAFNTLDGIAILIALAAFCGVGLADRQLLRFRSEQSNRGRVCEVGLWRYSRHPNYFFEWVHWLAYPLLAWGTAHWGFVLMLSVLMLVFLLKLTGIPFNEQQNLRSKGAAYRAYQRRTNSFFPGPTRGERKL